MAVATRIQRLKAQYGEACLVESIAESQPPTAREVTLTLSGKRCRRPKAGCRFHQLETNTYGFGPAAVATTIADLQKRQVVALYAVEPLEFAIVL